MLFLDSLEMLDSCDPVRQEQREHFIDEPGNVRIGSISHVDSRRNSTYSWSLSSSSDWRNSARLFGASDEAAMLHKMMLSPASTIC